MNACTHGQPLWHHLAVGDLCPVCRRTIVAVAVADATGHRGGVGTEATPQASLECHPLATIATGVAPDRKAGDGPPPVVPAPVATIATPAPTTAVSAPSSGHGNPFRVTERDHGAGVAPNAHESVAAHRGPSRDDSAPVAAGAHYGAARARAASPTPAATPSLLALQLRSSRLTDPDTSHEAAASVTDVQRRTVYRAVLEAIVEHGPCTDHDPARYVSGKLGHPIGQTSVGVRRGELRNAGLVADSGHKGRTETGAKAIRWALTPAGIDAAGGVAA